MEKAYQTCLELLDQRGYKIIEESDGQILAVKQNGDQICVCLSTNPKFNVERVQEYITIMKQMEVYHAIIIYKDNVTPVAKKVIEESKEMVIELFQEEEMQYNITKHYLVPKHELLYKKGSSALKEFKDKFSDKFPIILKNDPVCRFYGYSRGDIIKVTRENGTIMYRIVK